MKRIILVSLLVGCSVFGMEEEDGQNKSKKLMLRESAPSLRQQTAALMGLATEFKQTFNGSDLPESVLKKSLTEKEILQCEELHAKAINQLRKKLDKTEIALQKANDEKEIMNDELGKQIKALESEGMRTKQHLSDLAIIMCSVVIGAAWTFYSPGC